jgi:hypothetical protein
MNHTTFNIGHVLIKVDNLHQAVKDFEQIGFHVTYGSDPKKSSNAMIYFRDGSFLELFSTNFGQPINGIMKFMVKVMLRMKHPYAGRLQEYTLEGEGFRDYALDSNNVKEFVNNMQRLTQLSLNLFGPRHMKRKNVDGILVSWSLQYPSDQRLPFFMSPYHPNIDVASKSIHSNGVLCFDKVVIMTTKWDKDLAWYQTVFEQNPEMERNENQMFCCFSLNDVKLVLMNGDKDGICQVVLKSEHEKTRRKVISRLCHGADIFIEHHESFS